MLSMIRRMSRFMRPAGVSVSVTGRNCSVLPDSLTVVAIVLLPGAGTLGVGMGFSRFVDFRCSNDKGIFHIPGIDASALATINVTSCK